MADQKKWFKVWTSILSDDDFDIDRPNGLEDVGRWVKLGAYMAQHGNSGTVEIMPDTLFRMLKVEDLDVLKRKNIMKNILFEEGKSDYGKITVTWHKWYTYQEDSTAGDRNKTLRRKRRGEERRREEKNIVSASPRKISLLTSKNFEELWSLYPRKQAKARASQAFRALELDSTLQAEILNGLERAKHSDQWRQENGRYIPHLATWLHAEGWKDEYHVSLDGSKDRLEYFDKLPVYKHRKDAEPKTVEQSGPLGATEQTNSIPPNVVE